MEATTVTDGIGIIHKHYITFMLPFFLVARASFFFQNELEAQQRGG